MNIRMIIVAMLLALASSSADSKPIQLKASLVGENQPFVGTWEAKKESDYRSRSYDNTVLVLMSNGGAMFKHCAKRQVGSTSSVSGTILSFPQDRAEIFPDDRLRRGSCPDRFRAG